MLVETFFFPIFFLLLCCNLHLHIYKPIIAFKEIELFSYKNDCTPEHSCTCCSTGMEIFTEEKLTEEM